VEGRGFLAAPLFERTKRILLLEERLCLLATHLSFFATNRCLFVLPLILLAKHHGQLKKKRFLFASHLSSLVEHRSG
jgi:hypothetical protein